MNKNSAAAITAIALLATLTIAAQLVAQGDPVPLINLPLVPGAIPPGAAGFLLTVNGTGFVRGSVVNWNGRARATTFVSSRRLTARILASDVKKPGTASVTVTNPIPGGGTSNVLFFEVTVPTTSVPLDLTSTLGIQGVANSFAVGDFNGDGKLDVAIANSTESSQVTVLLGKGDGTFLSPENYPTPYSASSIVVGDFNRDGKLDLAVSHGITLSGVSVFLGNGDGTFQAAVEYTTGRDPSGIVAGDFNHDGTLDLAVADSASGSVSVLLGNGDGTFQAAADYAVGSNPNSVAIGDFNQDGNLDLAVANEDSNSVSILLGNGNGTFQPAADFNVGLTPFSVAVGDLNGDGILDLAVANYGSNSVSGSNTVSVLLGKGNGTFQNGMTYPMSSNPASVLLADMNGDGTLDLVIGQVGSNVSLLLGNGDGTFQAARDYPAGSEATPVAVGDFNGDGRLDFAVGDQSSPLVLLQLTSVSLSGTSLIFSDQLVGTSSARQTITLTAGILPLVISNITVTGTNASDFNQTNTCGSGIAVGAKCTISVAFTPTQVGPRAAVITITDNAVGSPQSVALQGTAVKSGPNITLSPTSLTFPTQAIGTTSTAKIVTLTNYGTNALSITGIAITGANAKDFARSHNCGTSLAVGASCSISLTFKPSASGTRTAAVAITDNAAASPQEVGLSGIGTTAKVSPTSLNLGRVTIGDTSAPQTVTLTNVGTTSLSITGIAITGTNPGDFAQTHTCGTSLAAGASCSISVTFKPTASGAWPVSDRSTIWPSESLRPPPATRKAALLSVSDNGGGSPQIVTLSGFAVSAMCILAGQGCVPTGTRCCPGLTCVACGILDCCR